MISRSGLRVTLGLVFAISALGLIAAPAAAETVTAACSGNCGYYEVYDTDMPLRGGSCFYQGSFPYKLTSMSVRAPLMHGDYPGPGKTKVGWRFRIQRQGNGGGAWSTIYTSGYQTAKANDAIPAYNGHGFSRRTWNAPANPNGYRYREALDLKWWKANGTVDGTLSLKYDWYKRQRAGGGKDIQPNYCIQAF